MPADGMTGGRVVAKGLRQRRSGEAGGEAERATAQERAAAQDAQHDTGSAADWGPGLPAARVLRSLPPWPGFNTAALRLLPPPEIERQLLA